MTRHITNIRLEIWVSILVGLSIPLMAFGRSMLQGALALALLGAVVVDRGALFRALKPLLASPFFYLMVVMVVVWTPGLFASPEPWHSVTTWARTPLFIAASALLWAFLREKKDRLDGCHRAILVGGLVMTFLVVLSIYAIPELAPVMKGHFSFSDKIRPQGYFKSFASALICLIPLAIWSGAKMSGNWRWIGLGVAVLSMVVILKTGSRSALFGVGVMAIFFIAAISLTRRKWMPAGGFFIAAVIGGTIVYLLDSQGWRAENPNDFLPSWLVDSHRQQIWLFVIERAKEAPWFGHGINAVNFLPGAGEMASGVKAEVLPSHPHNWVLEILVETGALGLAVLLVLLSYVFFGELGRFLRTGSTAALTLMALMTGFWGSSMFNFSIWSSWWLSILFVSFAIVRAGNTSSPSRE